MIGLKIITEALRRYLTIAQRIRPNLVPLSIKGHRKLAVRNHTRKTGRLETMPDDLFQDVKEAISVYERESDET